MIRNLIKHAGGCPHYVPQQIGRAPQDELNYVQFCGHCAMTPVANRSPRSRRNVIQNAKNVHWSGFNICGCISTQNLSPNSKRNLSVAWRLTAGLSRSVDYPTLHLNLLLFMATTPWSCSYDHRHLWRRDTPQMQHRDHPTNLLVLTRSVRKRIGMLFAVSVAQHLKMTSVTWLVSDNFTPILWLPQRVWGHHAMCS